MVAWEVMIEVGQPLLRVPFLTFGLVTCRGFAHYGWLQVSGVVSHAFSFVTSHDLPRENSQQIVHGGITTSCGCWGGNGMFVCSLVRTYRRQRLLSDERETVRLREQKKKLG